MTTHRTTKASSAKSWEWSNAEAARTAWGGSLSSPRPATVTDPSRMSEPSPAASGWRCDWRQPFPQGCSRPSPLTAPTGLVSDVCGAVRVPGQEPLCGPRQGGWGVEADPLGREVVAWRCRTERSSQRQPDSAA